VRQKTSQLILDKEEPSGYSFGENWEVRNEGRNSILNNFATLVFQIVGRGSPGEHCLSF
jgi:hypothetical protein